MSLKPFPGHTILVPKLLAAQSSIISRFLLKKQQTLLIFEFPVQ